MADEFKYKHRAGTAAQWADPQDGPLLRAEIGVLLDDDGTPLGVKVGDGETAFADLPLSLGGDNGTYAATRLWLPASRFTVASGSPAMGVIAKVPVMLFDAAVNEIASVSTDVPAGWATYNVNLWWVNAGAGSGAVRWRLDVANLADGVTLTDPTTAGTQPTPTALAQNVVETTAMRTTAQTAPTDAQALVLELVRLGGDAADTLPNDAGVLGLMLVKVS